MKQGATKQTRKEYQRISDETNDALAYYLRTGRKTVTVDGKRVSLEKAFNMTEKTSSEIAVAGNKIRKIISSIRRDSVKAGLDIGFVKNYLPRGFDYNAVKQEIKNLEKGIEGDLVKELKRAEGFKTNAEVHQVLEEIINPTSLVGKSYSELVSIGKGGTREVGYSKRIPAMAKERKLTNIDETKISDYLDNNVENLVYDYIQQAGGYLQRKIHLGEDLAEFNSRFVQPIIKTLESKGSALTSKEIKTLENIYLVTTGQVAGIDNAAMRTLANIAIVGNQLALLPLATITSLSEIAVPLVRGAGKKFIQKGKGQDNLGAGGIRLLFESGNKYRKMWWNDIVKKDLADSRPQALKELNRFNRALNRAGEDRALAMYGQGFGRRATQAQNKFFKLNLLHDWTRFVQLTSFNVGKSKMYENLFELATNKRLTAKKILRLENELKELGVDVVQGKKWVLGGGKPSGKFYDESFLPSAARYVDEVIMNPTAAANQKPLWHSMPSTRWAFGLMGFPTAFSNTVIKNAVREVGKDIRSGSLHATPSVVMGATTMISIAMFGNTLRTGGRNIEEMEAGTTYGPFESSVSNEIFKASLRTGMVGPFESSYRASQEIKYNNFVSAVLKNFTGPAVNDILDLVSRTEGVLTVALDKIPAIGLLKTTSPEGYKEIKKAVRALDPTTAQNRKKTVEKKQALPRVLTFYKGGEVDVPYTKDEPEDRVDKFTGRPYSDQMARLGFNQGTRIDDGKADIVNIDLFKDIIREEEGLEYEAYKPDPTEEHHTIGYGHYGEDVKEGMIVSLEEAENLLDDDVRVRLNEINRAIPKFNSFSQDLQTSLFSEYYRGSIPQSPNTRKLINEGKYSEAADEFLDNAEYRNAEELGIPGIRGRMEKVFNALKKERQQYNEGGGGVSLLQRRQGYWLGSLAAVIARNSIKSLSKANRKRLNKEGVPGLDLEDLQERVDIGLLTQKEADNTVVTKIKLYEDINKQIEKDNIKLARKEGYSSEEAKEITNLYKGEKLSPAKLATKLSPDMTFGEQRIFIGKNRHLQYTPEGKNLGIGWHDVTGMESSKKLTPREQLKKQLDTFPKIKDKSGEQYWKFVNTLIDNNFEMAKGSAWATSGGRGRKVIMYNYTTGDAVTMDMKRINLTKNKKILVRFHDNNTSIRTHHRSFKNSKKFWSPKSLDTFLKKMFENK